MTLFSFSFLLYFLPIVMIVYHLLRRSLRAQNIWLLIASLFFFGWVDLLSLFLLVLMIAANYELAFQARKAKEKGKTGKWALWCTVAVNIGVLFLSRYLSPMMSSIESLIGQPINIGQMISVMGISFIALRGISYVLDIYRGKAEPEKSFVNCALYICYFPFLFAGPIVRYQDIAGQLRERKTTLEGFSRGLCRLVIGLAKNVLLAQPLAALVNNIFTLSSSSGILTITPAMTALLGLLGFALQIYYQLSGISDMVIGLGGMCGFTIAENFDYPIMSSSVADFWSRSYSSLPQWFGEYVREPLNARKNNIDRLVRNSLVMWLLIGLWTGPSLSSIIFGVWSFLLILIEEMMDFETRKIGKPIRRIYVLLTMLLGLSALRSEGIYAFSLFISNLFGANKNGFSNEMTFMFLREYWVFFVVGIVFLFPIAPWLRGKIAGAGGFIKGISSIVYIVGIVALLALSIIAITRTSNSLTLWTEFNLWSMLYV